MRDKGRPPLLDDAATMRVLRKVKKAGELVPSFLFDESSPGVREVRTQIAILISHAFTVESYTKLRLNNSSSPTRKRLAALAKASNAVKTILSLVEEGKQLNILRQWYATDNETEPKDRRLPEFDELLGGLQRLHEVTNSQWRRHENALRQLATAQR